MPSPGSGKNDTRRGIVAASPAGLQLVTVRHRAVYGGRVPTRMPLTKGPVGSSDSGDPLSPRPPLDENAEAKKRRPCIHALYPRHFSLLATAAGASLAWAKWGCAARSPANYWSNSYNDSTKAQASTEALKGCRTAGGKGCHIISCSANVNTDGQANTIWPPSGPTFGRILFRAN
jgi:hypothetical protein